MMTIRNTLLLLVIPLIGACVTPIPYGGPDEDARLKQFSPNPERAGIYLYLNQHHDQVTSVSIIIDGERVAEVVKDTYFHVELTPGKHKIRSRAENSESLVIDAVAGEIYYLWQEIEIDRSQSMELGWAPMGINLQMVSAEEGQRNVLNSRLVLPLPDS